MNEGAGDGGGRRLRAAAGTALRTLRTDLWTVARDPLPRMRWLGRLPHAHVVLFAVLMFLLNANDYQELLGGDRHPDETFPTRLLLLLVLQTAAAVLALTRPVLAWWLSTLALFLTAQTTEPVVDHDSLWPWSVAGVALHTLVLLLLALRVRPRVAVEALVVTLLAGMVNMAFAAPVAPAPAPGGHNDDLTRGAVSFATAVVVGASLRLSRVARNRLVVQEELTAEERARRTLLEERGRIARELHDVVAHHMSVISIQAQVAPHLVDNPSDALKENLAGIRENAVEALTELRRVLGVLRSEEAPSQEVRHAPQPTLDRLDELIGKVRSAGVAVTAETAGEPRPLAPGVELSAFRIVQEALSNAMRHAPGAAVRVTVGYHVDGLALRIANAAADGPAPPSPGSGHGLLGMRERTAMLGGELAVGRTPDGGYEVTALLPDNADHPSAAPGSPDSPVEDTR
ncbi:sensor histidine kinase [Streptomyces sp. NPDC058989]|uniref:sensor histidine kinase n=1 Tax=Streptomyces sp. NPDC058989 TaxID=3346686 RepID=UPI003677808B